MTARRDLLLRAWLGALLMAAPGGALLAAAAPLSDIKLAAHKAVYDLALDRVTGGGAVAASGILTYQVIDACTSWATQQQLRLRSVTRDGGAREVVSDYATLEAKDGRRLAFDMKQISDGVVAQQLRGEATLEADGSGHVRFTQPRHFTIALPRGTLFPMIHTESILRAARAGLRQLSLPLFDGTGTDAEDTYVSILGWHPAPTADAEGWLRPLGSTRVHVAFFGRSPGSITPEYEAGMRYFDNGVSDRLEMDFGDFTMHGTTRSLQQGKAPAHC